VKRLFNVYLTLIKRRLNVILTKFKRYSNVISTSLSPKDMLWRFARRRHRIFRPVVLSPLSIIYHPFTLQIILLHSLNLRQYLGEEENFARCINLFWKSTPSDTTINPSELGGV